MVLVLFLLALSSPLHLHTDQSHGQFPSLPGRCFWMLYECYLGIQEQCLHMSHETMVTESKTRLHTNLASETMSYIRALKKHAINVEIFVFCFYLFVCLDRVLL